jgi:hypothetical protein
MTSRPLAKPIAPQPQTLPKSGRVRLSDISLIGALIRDAATEDQAQERAGLLGVLRAAVRDAYAQQWAKSDMEVLARFRLLDFAEAVTVKVSKENDPDSWRDLKVNLAERVNFPHNRSISFYVGGIDDVVVERNRERGEWASPIIDWTDTVQDPAARALIRLNDAIYDAGREVMDFARGFNDGNTQVRPLWTEVYEKFPLLARYREA